MQSSKLTHTSPLHMYSQSEIDFILVKQNHKSPQ